MPKCGVWFKTVWKDEGRIIAIKEIAAFENEPQYRALSIIDLNDGMMELEIYWYDGLLEVRKGEKKVEIELNEKKPWFFNYWELRDAIYRHGTKGAARMIALTVTKYAWLSFSL